MLDKFISCLFYQTINRSRPEAGGAALCLPYADSSWSEEAHIAFRIEQNNDSGCKNAELELIVSKEQHMQWGNAGETTSREAIIDGKFAAEQEFCQLSGWIVVSTWQFT
jgi:hypothetical protein